MILSANGIALAGFALLAGCVLYLVGGPLIDSDFWWHLAHGRAYLEAGPWLDADPCLGTADRGPIPHQWGFAVVARGVELLFGLYGLRVAHALAAVAIAWLGFRACRREAGSLAPALLGTAVLLVLGWYRFVQLRPELMTLVGVLLLHPLLFAPALPSWRQVGLSVGLIALWANVHAAFMVGPLLIAAALAGVGVRLVSARLSGAGDAAAEGRRAGRLAAALGLGLIAGLANPRGVAQHTAYLDASRSGAIQFVADEWARFDPFAHTNLAPAVSALSWVVADVLIVAFLVSALVAILRFLRDPSAERLDDADPVRIALGIAALVAMFSAIRFLWLGVFPMLYLLHITRRVGALERLRGPVAAAATVSLAMAFPSNGGFRDVAVHLPSDWRGWISESHASQRFFEQGVRFLKETGVRGQLFHDYALGGYLCHQLAPGVRSFVDGSMNYPEDVAVDYGHLIVAKGATPEEGFSRTLDRRGVDLFFGFGVPLGGEVPYTTAALEGHPDWTLVSRSWRHGIYLRANAANQENLTRIADWYATQGIDFDPLRGFDPGRVIREHREWSDAWGMLPAGWSAQIEAVSPGARKLRVDALETVGLGYALVGAYREQVANDRRAALRRDAKAPRRRLIYGLLRQGRLLQALSQARELVALDPDDPRSNVFARVVGEVSRATSPEARIAAINALPLLSSRQPLRQ